MPVYDVMEDCGIDGNSGPFLVTRIETALTKLEYFAGLAMQGLCQVADNNGSWAQDPNNVAIAAVEYAEALLSQLQTADDGDNS